MRGRTPAEASAAAPANGFVQTNGFVERFQRTVGEAFFAGAFRRRLYESVEALQGELDAWLARLRTDGHTIAALERTAGAVPIEAVGAAQFPLVLVLGNEVQGVLPDLLAVADLVLALPQYGTKTSLNISVAFGIAAYGLVARLRALTAPG